MDLNFLRTDAGRTHGPCFPSFSTVVRCLRILCSLRRLRYARMSGNAAFTRSTLQNSERLFMFNFFDTMRISLGISLNSEMSFKKLHVLSDSQNTVSLLIGD
jgi:hypothetical protein